MDSRTFTVQQIYQDRRQYRVPFYQRPYVWNRDDQWGRLWEDIRDKADARLQGGKAVPHFMGAVVLEPQKKGRPDCSAWSGITSSTVNSG